MSGDSGLRLRGRQDELRILDTLCDTVRTGHSATIVIRGEPGIGKTALLRHVAHNVAADFRIAEIAGFESEMQLAYAGLHQLCSPMLDGLESLPPPQQSALRVALGISEGSAPDPFLVGLATLGLLAECADARPLMCLIDDAQWLDHASCEVLGFVARRVAAESVAIVFAIRAGRQRSPRDPLAGLNEMPVSGVAEADARALLATVVPGKLDKRVRDRIVAETRGNPLALLELPRGMSPAELAGGFGLPVASGVAAQMEIHFLRRMRRLPEPTQRLMLLAAADPVGDATTIWRAATSLGIGTDAAAPAAAEELLEMGRQVRFHHPLVRSAVYRSASSSQRRAVHAALAEATDPSTDSDRRAWHHANATSGRDDGVADELEHCAGRAQARGGYAAAAALLERSASLTIERARRVERRLAAAHSNLRGGSFDVASGLLAMADSEASDEFSFARVQLLRGLVASAANAGNDAPLQLLKAAKRFGPLDAAVARQAYTDALIAAMFAGHLAAPGGSWSDVWRAARTTARPIVAPGPFGDIFEALAVLVTDGRAQAEPVVRRALQRLLSEKVADESWLHWGVLGALAAAAVWDADSWAAVSARHVALARELGALSALPTSLSGLALLATWRGDFHTAAALAAEHEAITEAAGIRIAPFGAMLLAAYQGRPQTASALIMAITEDSSNRGEGLGVDLARWSATILNISIGHYAEALGTASPADPDQPAFLVSTWVLPERIEAAVRSGQPDVAAAALEEFRDSASVGDSDWGLGLTARSSALLTTGTAAEGFYREAVERLSRTGLQTELARAHLLFGEWLRRESRPTEARSELHTAHDLFAVMPADAFAERTRRELFAAGDHVRTTAVRMQPTLTPQEEQIARLATDGRTNAEIAAELYLSARTVEWHLRKIFTKLDITSRRSLGDALPDPSRSAQPV